MYLAGFWHYVNYITQVQHIVVLLPAFRDRDYYHIFALWSLTSLTTHKQ